MCYDTTIINISAASRWMNISQQVLVTDKLDVVSWCWATLHKALRSLISSSFRLYYGHYQYNCRIRSLCSIIIAFPLFSKSFMPKAPSDHPMHDQHTSSFPTPKWKHWSSNVSWQEEKSGCWGSAGLHESVRNKLMTNACKHTVPTEAWAAVLPGWCANAAYRFPGFRLINSLLLIGL